MSESMPVGGLQSVADANNAAQPVVRNGRCFTGDPSRPAAEDIDNRDEDIDVTVHVVESNSETVLHSQSPRGS
jgi:hypothetical protein